MPMDDVLTLISVDLQQNGFGGFSASGETRREVFGSVASVARSEWYEAGRKGMNPEIVFTTPCVNYESETEAEFHGVRYGIYRTYRVRDTDEIELYLERKAGGQ